MAQTFEEGQDGIGSPGALGEGRSMRKLSFWTYPEKFRTIEWSKTMRKVAKGLDGVYLGRVHTVESHYVRTVRGVIRKEMFLIPRELAQAFDGYTLWFGVKTDLLHQYRSTNATNELVRASHARSPETQSRVQQGGRDRSFVR
jgi:hypothetical protein